LKVFISYAREDVQIAERLYESLREYPDLNPWLDRRNLVGGTSWLDSIVDAISSSDVVVLLISLSSISKSTFIRREVELIIEKTRVQSSKLLILPVRLEDCAAPWPEIASLEMIDVFASWTDGLHRIMLAIRGRTDESSARLADAFPDLSKEQRYRRARLLLLSEEGVRSWRTAFEDLLCALPPSVIFQRLDSIHPIYMDEIVDLALALDSVRRRHPEAVPAYVFRIHEVAKHVDKAHELPEAYGTALSAGRLLDGPVRTMLIRDMFSSFVGVSRHALFGLSTWPQQWTFCELAKHLLVSREARYESNREIVEVALQGVSHDVPLLDLLVFAGALAGDSHFLLAILARLKHFCSREIALPSIPQELISVARRQDLASVDLGRFEKLERADANLAARTRLGAIARIGEYLRRDPNGSVRTFGDSIAHAALEAMGSSKSSLAAVVNALGDRQRAKLFSALETYDGPVTDAIVGPDVAAELRQCWTDYFYTVRGEHGWAPTPVTLDAELSVIYEGCGRN
jgi:hypothetical protein